MKKAYYIYILLGLMLISCSEDFTDLAPISNRNEAEFYNTSNDFITAINSSYAGLQKDGVYGRSYWTMFEMRSENTDQGPDATGLARQFAEINTFDENPLNEQITAAWIDSFDVIANCNIVLDRIEQAEIDSSLKNRIKGEALFLRSLMYYHLAIAYGNIPLQIKPYVQGEELVQVSASEIYNQLINDLNIAEEALPESYSEGETGRATKGAAATLLAKVQLTLGQKSEAETVLRRIVNNYDYKLLDNYENIWGVENENNAESIFEVQFISGGIGQGSPFTNDFSPSAFLQTGSGFGRNRPTDALVNSYSEEDLRFEPSIGTSYINAEGETTLANYIKKYESEPQTEYDSDVNFIVFRYADVLLMLAEALGESPEAYGLINEVRNRAGLEDIDENSPGTFDEKLLHERQLELAFENHRWPDLRRFGAEREVFETAEEVVEPSDVRELFYIPQRELDINPNFTQNN
ncbi:RagB/SusD family nutrient uptake outer membrane protein [Salegentibacter mishustinae]|uniref:RagB/SusD family nutrient uptake outer membrane protein n=1 Tax=Salegentibacter mishustinae TaxID=270918 RepID=UPI001CE0CDC6|nr:RagB/SusD family nutrient uptake outer membrane protein [Salegentibacter mishustinae]UBZ05613.1 RagB/SusD family nutrient uptake outer membrane protein [Salegentibacter mishustinae]